MVSYFTFDVDTLKVAMPSAIVTKRLHYFISQINKCLKMILRNVCDSFKLNLINWMIVCIFSILWRERNWSPIRSLIVFVQMLLKAMVTTVSIATNSANLIQNDLLIIQLTNDVQGILYIYAHPYSVHAEIVVSSFDAIMSGSTLNSLKNICKSSAKKQRSWSFIRLIICIRTLGVIR